ncbi:MAG: hypothetical protein M3Y76_06825 [Chloroflexota bacterium]|nr:hypothetical protein [Chloroflexota bacterium]
MSESWSDVSGPTSAACTDIPRWPTWRLARQPLAVPNLRGLPMWTGGLWAVYLAFLCKQVAPRLYSLA